MLFACLLVFTPLLASADVSITVTPPAVPIYDQPPSPGDGYLWVPGYWAYGEDDYYWVPGVWVLPPEVGFLWTPGWWGAGDGGYVWNPGYWGPHVGFYGGVNYGFGYYGTGFWGGHWEGGHFFYNTAAWHVGPDIHNTYVNHSWVEEHNRASFHGPGGIERKPTDEEERAGHEGRREMTEAQRAHEHEAIRDRGQKFSENKGTPGKTALTKTTHETLTKTTHETLTKGTHVTEHHATAGHPGAAGHPGTAQHPGAAEHHTAQHHATTQPHAAPKAPQQHHAAPKAPQQHHAPAPKKNEGKKKQ